MLIMIATGASSLAHGLGRMLKSMVFDRATSSLQAQKESWSWEFDLLNVGRLSTDTSCFTMS